MTRSCSHSLFPPPRRPSLLYFALRSGRARRCSEGVPCSRRFWRRRCCARRVLSGALSRVQWAGRLGSRMLCSHERGTAFAPVVYFEVELTFGSCSCMWYIRLPGVFCLFLHVRELLKLFTHVTHIYGYGHNFVSFSSLEWRGSYI